MGDRSEDMLTIALDSFAERETLADYLLGAPAGRTRTTPGAAPKPH